MLDIVLVLKGEILSWSLMGGKGLRLVPRFFVTIVCSTSLYIFDCTKFSSSLGEGRRRK